MADHHTPRVPSPAQLGARFDHLPYSARTSALCRYARTLGQAPYEQLRQALDSGSDDDRQTGLLLAIARRDTARVGAALHDPLLCRRALSAAIRLPVPEDDLTRAALDGPRAVRHGLYRVLRLSRRRDTADRLLPEVRTRHGDLDAARLLPACSPAAADRWLPALAVPTGVLHSLARTAPLAVAHALIAEERGAQQTGSAPRGTARLVSVVATRDRQARLLLLDAAPRLLTPAAVTTLLREPGAVLKAVRSQGIDRLPVPDTGLPRGVQRTLRALPPGDLAELAAVCRLQSRGLSQSVPEPVLALLPPDERRRAAESWTGGRGARVLSAVPALLALEPADRATLVRRLLAGRTGRRPYLRARLLSALPLAEAEPELRSLAESHRRSDREVGWSALIACSRLDGDPRAHARVLRSAERAWHDQCFVREAALGQCADTPEPLLASVPLEVLRDAALTTLQARDTTVTGLGRVHTWLHRTAQQAAEADDPARVAAAAELMAWVAAHPRAVVQVRPLRVPAMTARQVWERCERSLPRPDLLLTVAELLGECVAEVPGLDSWLRERMRDPAGPGAAAPWAVGSGPVERVVRLWTGPRSLREERCAELVRADPSYAAVEQVWRMLALRRTDLLGRVLAAALDGGPGALWPRPGTGLPPLPPGARGRWRPADRATHDRLLQAVAADPAQDIGPRTAAAREITDPQAAAELARTAPQPVAAAALSGLAGTSDTGGALPVLLACAQSGGVRGRAALAGLRQLLRRLPDGEAVRIPAGVLQDQGAPVGARKEAARTLGDVPGEEARQALLHAWDDGSLHRDVRAAVAVVLLDSVDREEIRDRLVAQLAEPAVREALFAVRTAALPVPARVGHRLFLVRAMSHSDTGTASAACEAYCRSGPPTAEAARAAARLVLALDAPLRHCAPAIALLSRGAGELAVRQAWLDAVLHLAGLARAGRDRRAVARLVALASGFADCAPDLLDALVEPLAAAGLPGRAAEAAGAAAVKALVSGHADVGRWDRCLDLVEAGPLRLPQLPLHGPGWQPDRLPRQAVSQVLSRLRARGTASAGVLAVRLLASAGQADEWAKPWRTELERWRRHPDPDVAECALLVDIRLP
ncbi:hypothetical protein [Peterkaempfera sp. SMS 1(5)a]|uniref:hypothetical protein n=1 Tax=Peterkaempfera podocarpi TaxID=3232308 RepID=UPI0036706C6E